VKLKHALSIHKDKAFGVRQKVVHT